MGWILSALTLERQTKRTTAILRALGLSFSLFLTGLWASAASTELSELQQRYLGRLGDSSAASSDFAAIAKDYATVMKREKRDTPLHHYNAGTMFLKGEDYGHAIAHLSQAFAMEPNDQRIVDHLRRAHLQGGIEMESSQQLGLLNWIKSFWKRTLPLHWQVLACLCSIAALVLGFVPSLGGSKLTVGALCFGTVFFLGTALLHQSGIGIERKGILTHAYNPRSGLGPQYPGILRQEDTMAAGSAATILREQSGWKEVLFSGGQRGWLPKEKLREIF